MMNRLPHTVTVVAPVTSTDAYGVTTLTYPGPGTVVPAWIQPQVSEESTTGRVLTRLKVYTIDAVPVTYRVAAQGETFEVTSSVRWDDGRGQVHHYELLLEQVEG